LEEALSAAMAGVEIADIVIPRPTSCAVLDDGDRVEFGV
jgi:hypothetical protein